MLKVIFISILLFLLCFGRQDVLLAQTDTDDSNDEVSQEIQNDEGYGRDDTEYYSSESDNETVVEEPVNTTDDEMVNDEAEKDATVEGDAVDDVPSAYGK